MSNIKYHIPNATSPYLQGYFDDRDILEDVCIASGLDKELIQEVDTNSDAYILRDIPIEFHSTLSYMAYDRGHSAGRDEVAMLLRELAYELKNPIEEFRKNLLESLKTRA